MTDLTGLTLGLLAALAWGSTDAFASVVSRRIGSLATSAATQLTSVGVILVSGQLLGAQTRSPPDDRRDRGLRTMHAASRRASPSGGFPLHKLEHMF